jgi:hypothetical protein
MAAVEGPTTKTNRFSSNVAQNLEHGLISRAPYFSLFLDNLKLTNSINKRF